MKRIVLLLTMLAMVPLMAAPALAQGQVEQGTDHANSICSFSGQNDNPNDEFPENGRTQSYGQIVSKLVKVGVNVSAGPGRAAPGVQCNGHTHPYPEAFSHPI